MADTTVRAEVDVPQWTATEVLRRGWRESPELRQGAGITLLLALIGAAGKVAVPILIQQAIDRGLSEEGTDVATVAWLGLIAAVVIVVAAIAQRAAVIRLAVRSEHALYGLRTRAFTHIHRLSLAHHADERKGRMVARVTSDIDTMSQFFSWGGIAWVVNGALMLAVFVTMLVYDVALALLVVVCVAPLIFVLRALQRHLVRAYSQLRERVGDTLSGFSEVVTGAAVIRAYDVEEPTTARVDQAVESQRDVGIHASVLGALLFPSGEIFSVLTVAAVLLVGLWQGPAAGLTAGALIGFIFLVYRFLEPIAEFSEILDQTQTAVAGWRRVLAVLETPIEIVDPANGVALAHEPPAIEAEALTFRYRPRAGQDAASASAALEGVSFRIEPATSVAVVGATGSGKTTLARLLTRLADPTEGRVLIGGHDLRTISFTTLRRTMVMVPQDAFLFDTTIAENVRFGHRGASDDDVHLAFTELGLEGWLATLPDGLDTRVGERGEHLSAGERQLVALARAYVANPACLVLDEATSAVDPATEARLTRALESLARGRTSVTIAHRLSTAARADWVLVFDHGRLVEQGRHAELVAAGGVYARLHASWLDASSAVTVGGTAST